MKRSSKYLIAFILIICFSAISVSAATPYETYTYSYAGNVQISPAAYKPLDKISDFGKDENGEAVILNQPADIYYDDYRDYIIIADTGNNRVVVTNQELNCVKTIFEFEVDGNIETFNSPNGVFVTKDSMLYVADTKNSRIVVFDDNFKFLKILPAISSDILPEGFVYNPKNIAVDNAGNIYVVSMNSNMGVISLDPEGNFEGFFGAQEVSVNPLETLWRSFMSEEQLQRSKSYVSVEYSNITIDEKGFAYITCSVIDRYQLFNAVNSRSSSSAYAPIKKLNPAGTDVLVRNGFFPPVGEINFTSYASTKKDEPSEIADVELLANGVYALLDINKNKIYVYESNGNLLYAFGGEGEATGLYTSLCAFAWNNNRFYNLDYSDGSVTILSRTDYGELLDQVIEYQETLQYEKADSLWNTIISKNNNFDIAYLGLGKIALEQGKYEEAMDLFKLIGDKAYYQRAFKLYREEILSKIGILVFALIIIVVLVVVWLMGKIGKYNDKLTETPHSGRFINEILFGFYVIRHPFNGHWALKMEKRGTVRAATFWMILSGVSAIFAVFGACYLQKSENPSIISALSNTVFPLLLLIVSNMCFTTLMDGKGTFKDTYIAVSYSTVPYATFTIPLTLLSHVLISDELSILNIFTSVILAWVLMLVFCGLMSIHDYSFGKNIVVCALTILGIAFILFILIIFISLGSKVISLISSIISEILYRS